MEELNKKITETPQTEVEKKLAEKPATPIYTKRKEALNHALNLAIVLKNQRIYKGASVEKKVSRGYNIKLVATRKIARRQLRNEVGARNMDIIWNLNKRKIVQEMYGDRYERLTNPDKHINMYDDLKK
jgi:hypothetical protein